jgi:hypothetical protein
MTAITHITSTGHHSSPPVQIKGITKQHITYTGRLNWPPVQINAAAKQVQNWNNFRRAQETLSWVSTMLAISLTSLLAFSCLALKSSNACYCTRKYASEFSRDFLSPSASCHSTTDRCLSACSWDSRSQSDSGIEFEELVPAVVASNSNTTSRQDFGLSHYLQDRFYQFSWRPTGLSHYL